ncbi:alpha-1,2-mannosidase, putative [Salegentibacter holothuriorum]|uniref:Alpha-1,2-mannosidase, putative n=1 Tax=Salegentibacter holothuriorum TaxID=241145 RepID=A0A1T5BGM7_9FLAO|nr:GH92 family glycosyl hydrolase [Salegentibacter holothuriorum]SKB45983.1 alpha-1,2-mannosidase, putative [Salegentibacter holothuriorum]
MFKKFPLLFFIFLLALVSCEEQDDKATDFQKSTKKLTSYVDPFIGTGGHGHTYPGASSPFGMVQVSPDNGTSGWDWVSGYHYSDSLVAGFSHLHLSGTGIGDLADILFMPVNRKIDLGKEVKERKDIPYLSKYSHIDETARPGYYQIFLEDFDINVELSATQRTAYHKYTFGKGEEKSVVIDLGFAINWDEPTETAIKVEDEYTITGYRHSIGWANNQKVFFVAKFSAPIIESELFSGKNAVAASEVSNKKTSAQLYFDKDSKELKVAVALSSVSIENARENMDGDANFNFNTTKKEANESWEKALSDIIVESPTDSLKTIFYSALYHTKLAPVIFSDKNGEFRLQNDSIVQKDFTTYSTLSLWDTFRAQNPLLTLTNPEITADIVNSMLVYYEESGSLPVWTLYGNETNTMTGYHSVPVIVEAYFKGIKGFDVEKAYEALKVTMMQDQRSLKELKEYGYIPYNLGNESVTKTLEYAYNDWCVAQMAEALGKQEDYGYFSERAKAYKELFDPETGFMRGKSPTGEWNTPFDPKHSNHRVNTDYTEGNAWQHSWFVLHEPQGLIELHGGAEPFTAKLEELFSESSEITGDNTSADISGLIGQYAHGNEPSHHIAYLFNKAGQPWRTQYWVREILKTQYSTQPDGLSGNEDAGQMSAWYVFSSMGLYPFNPALAEYEIGSPIFEKSTINLKDGNSFKIIANKVSEENIYIQSATLNGEDFNQTTISHETLLEGGELVFEMGSTPNKNWGVNHKD